MSTTVLAQLWIDLSHKIENYFNKIFWTCELWTLASDASANSEDYRKASLQLVLEQGLKSNKATLYKLNREINIYLFHHVAFDLVTFNCNQTQNNSSVQYRILFLLWSTAIDSKPLGWTSICHLSLIKTINKYCILPFL